MMMMILTAYMYNYTIRFSVGVNCVSLHLISQIKSSWSLSSFYHCWFSVHLYPVSSV